MKQVTTKQISPIRYIQYFLVCLCLASLFSCGTKGTKVILLPQENGETRGVTVRNPASVIILDTPYTYSEIHKKTTGLSVQTIDPDTVQKMYGPLLAAEPMKPAIFLLYFISGGTDLTRVSKDLLPMVIEAAIQRQPSRISVIGHSDTTGAADRNQQLSLERARLVANILQDNGIPADDIDVRGFGESDLLIPTPDNTPEARNRRVEIMIR